MPGRTRHCRVAPLGNVVRPVVGPADEHDRVGATRLLARLGERFPRLPRGWGDGGDAGIDCRADRQRATGITLAVGAKPAGQLGFAVQPKRWLVARPIAWNGRGRRLSRDCEQHCHTSEALLYLASIHRLLKRLAPSLDQLHHRPAESAIQLALCCFPKAL